MSKLNMYRQTAVKTASREEILIMLYEGAIKHLKKAAEHCVSKDLQAKGIAVGKAHDIVNELTNTLDFEVGGEVAKNLERIYGFVVDLIVKGNLESEAAHFDQARKLLETLLEGWKGAVSQVRAEKARG